MKLHHYSLIFAIVSGCFLVFVKLETMNYKYAVQEKQYLEEVVTNAIDDAMVYFPEEEASSPLVTNKERAVSRFLDYLFSALDINKPETKEELEFYIPVILVSTMDGFYVYHTYEYKKDNRQTYYKKQWSEKYPFYYEDEDFIYRFTLTDRITIYDKNGKIGSAHV